MPAPGLSAMLSVGLCCGFLPLASINRQPVALVTGFMPKKLLRTQFATLQHPPKKDSREILFSILAWEAASPKYVVLLL